MKINMLLSGCLLGLLCFTACDSEGNEMNDYTHYVNPFIGTGGHGHTVLWSEDNPFTGCRQY